MAAAAASSETRSLKVYFVHTGEKAEITFKRNGRYDPEGLAQLSRILRDWRRNEPTKMDPRLFDLIWEAYQASGSREYLHVVSGYRSPATNGMLRSRSKSVAEKSQHMLGKAMDFYLPDVPLKKMREIGLKMQAGGVGYYPTSGSPFVHFDVGNVRHWPRMSRQELVALFPNGNTLHVPSDGKPLPGFDQALAAYEARKGSGELAIAMAAGKNSAPKRSRGLLAALFGAGGGADDEEDSAPAAPVVASAAPAPAPKASVKPAPAVTASAAAGGIQILSPDEAQRAEIPAFNEAAPQPTQAPETIVAALPDRGVPLPALAPRPQAEVGGALALAAAEPTPVNIPFGMAQDPLPATPAATAEVQELAFNVPLPTHRPDYTPPAQQDAVLLALAEPDNGPVLADTVLALPSSRPTLPQGEMVVAALPEALPVLPEPAKPDQIANAAAVEAEVKANDARMAALTSTTAPAEAMVQRAAEADAAAAVSAGAKTTPKAARASSQDAKPDRKPVTVAAVPQAANWVLHGSYVAQASEGTTAPSFAYNIVRTAPREVYTVGFQKGSQVADASRFTGKAVQFLSVARFQTN